MNAFVFCENSNLFIRKPNGLEYTFDNVDTPALGFEYEVLVYDEIEVKILKWDWDKTFHEQEKIPLSDNEKEIIENYISNSEPPEGVTLAGQIINRLKTYITSEVLQMCHMLGFEDLNEVAVAGREGSNHPYRSNARRVLEYVDAVWNVFDDVSNDVFRTREDHLKPLQEYILIIPRAAVLPDQER